MISMQGIPRPGGLCGFLGQTVLILVLLASTSGCGRRATGDPPAGVSGMVTYQGKPLEFGAIQFEPGEEVRSPGIAVRIKDGKYDVPIDHRLVAGDYRVRINGLRKTGRKIRLTEDEPDEDGQLRTQDEWEQYLPTKHNAESDRVITLDPGKNSRDFALD